MFVLAAAGGAAWAGWSDLRKKADDAKSKADDIRKTVPEDMKKVVAAMCQAGDDSRRSDGDSEASRARDHVRDQLDKFHRATREAIDGLKPIANDSEDANHSNANDLISELEHRRDAIDDQTRAIADGRPPVIDYIMRQSESARGSHASSCSSREVSLDGGTVPCIVMDSDTCTVVEVAFDNDRSIDKARERAGRERSWIEHEIQRESPPSSVANCKKVQTRVDCYKVCPDIDNDGTFREVSPSWRDRCSS
jgi:hypothetical protein|nr:hypothetical protein [Kofleriaceae bacterium]